MAVWLCVDDLLLERLAFLLLAYLLAHVALDHDRRDGRAGLIIHEEGITLHREDRPICVLVGHYALPAPFAGQHTQGGVERIGVGHNLVEAHACYRHWLLGVLCENDVPTHAPVRAAAAIRCGAPALVFEDQRTGLCLACDDRPRLGVHIHFEEKCGVVLSVGRPASYLNF
jgi:hypothetical protein